MRAIYLIFIFLFMMGEQIAHTVLAQTFVANVGQLIDAVSTAGEGDTIFLEGDAFDEIAAAITLTIPHSNRFVIDGGGKTLTTQASRYFVISRQNSGSMTLRNMTFAGFRTEAERNAGEYGTEGGGVELDGNGATFVVEDVRFLSIAGGALSVVAAAENLTVRLKNATFEGNANNEHGGAVCIRGANSLLVENCTFVENQSLQNGFSGGAICFLQTTGVGRVVNSVFLRNQTREHGGAISVFDASGGAVSINACYFEENKVAEGVDYRTDGGAVSVYGGEHSNVSFEATNSTFYRNEAADDGGAVFIENRKSGSSNYIGNCVFFENVGKDKSLKRLKANDTGTCGGAIHVSINSILTLENNTLVGNYTHKPAPVTPDDELNVRQGGGGLGYYYQTKEGNAEVDLKNNIIVGNYTLLMPDSIKIEGSYANVGFHQNYGGPTVRQSGVNIVYDAVPVDSLPEGWRSNPDLVVGKRPVLWENGGTIYAGNTNEKKDSAYYRIIPSLSILPRYSDRVGLADGGCAAELDSDIRGYARNSDNDRRDVGAVEIVWAKFDANGGAWNNLPDLSSYKGTEYYEKDASGRVESYYQVSYPGGEVVKPPYPVKEGAVFDGWRRICTGEDWDGQPYTITDNDSLIAVWTVCPLFSTWKVDAADDDWNDPGNWSHGVPGKCTRVTIAADAAHYPVLTAATDPAARCHTVYFEFGGEVAGTPFLDYDSASVDLTLDNSRWYMLAAPLRNMYSGDYILSENRRNPSVSMMQYQQDNPQYTTVVKQQGKWSNTFNTLGAPLNAADGFASKINLNETAENKLYTICFPSQERNYAYYDKEGNLTGRTTFDDLGALLERTHNGRFIYETASGYENGTFVLPIANADSEYENLIVGNPFMAHLDLIGLYQANQTRLTGTFRLWTGNVVETYCILGDGLVSTDGGANLETLSIAPMQSVFAECVEEAFEGLTFRSEMTVVQPSSTLRSASPPFDGLLRVEASRDGQRESAAAIVYRKGASNDYVRGEDAKAFFIANLQNRPAVVYSSVNGQALAVNTVGDLGEDVELAVSTSLTGRLTLDFQGMDSFDPDCTIEFVDRQSGHTLNLRETASYTFDNETGDVEGRFCLRIAAVSTQTDGFSPETSGIHLYVASGRLYVSASEEIRWVEVFDLQGRSLYRQALSGGQTRLDIPLTTKGQVAIVKIGTASAVEVRKLPTGR